MEKMPKTREATSDDLGVIADLMVSVYVTPRQKEALRRVVGVVTLAAGRARVATAEHRADEDEAKRHALLGPCGAE